VYTCLTATSIASGVCDQCCQARVTEEFELRLTYTAATIYVRKVLNSHKSDPQTTSSSPIELMDSDDNSVTTESSGDTHSQVHRCSCDTHMYIYPPMTLTHRYIDAPVAVTHRYVYTPVTLTCM